MKHYFAIFVGLLLSLISSAQETWKIDNGHSNINFEVGWEDFSVRTGEFKIFEGEIVTNSWEDLSNATFNLTVDPKSIDVIAERLSEQLKGDRFLDAEKFPEITFHSSGAKAVSDSTYITAGKLLIHGVEKDQDVLIRFEGFNKGNRNYTLGLKVTMKFNRNDYGLTWGSPRLGDSVNVVGYLLYRMRIEEE